MLKGERRLAAIMFTDMVGYTALTQSNESLALEVLARHHRLLRPMFRRFGGTEVKTIGDSFLVEFESALNATNCAVEIQKHLHEYNLSSKDEWKVRLRIGVHLGDVVHSSGDVLGDAVNLASRIEPLAEIGGVCVSEQVFDQVRNKILQTLVKLASRDLKNVHFPIDVYKVVMPWDEEKTTNSTYFDRNRVAVLPFVNISRDSTDEYFADGMTEEVIATMSRIGGLKVIARTSVMGYKGGQKKISDVARELEVGAILEGSVRKADDRVRVTVQLIDSQTSEHLWAESYDRELKDVLGVQGEIARTVAEELKVQLLSKEKAALEKKQTVNPEAYTLYLKGRFYWNERTKENVDRAMKYFEQSVKIAPEFAPSYSGLADCYNILADYGWMAAVQAAPLARKFSLKALEIDENLAEAHASLALTLMNHFWDFNSSEDELKRAIELRPSYALAHYWLALLMLFQGKLEESYSLTTQAIDIDPYSRVISMGIANALALVGRIKEAMKQYRQVIELNPDFAAVHLWKSTVHAWVSEYDSAIEEINKALDLERSPLSQSVLAWINAAMGKKENAQRILNELMRRAANEYVSPVWIGLIEFSLGRPDEGFKWLRKALSEKDNALLYFGSLPWFKEYRLDPRWKQIAAKLGIP